MFYKLTLNQFKKNLITDHSKMMLVLWFILIAIVCQRFHFV